MSVSRFTRFWLRRTNRRVHCAAGRRRVRRSATVNSSANPYKVIREWGKLPDRPWGGSTAWQSTEMEGPSGRSIVLAGHRPGVPGDQGEPRSQVR